MQEDIFASLQKRNDAYLSPELTAQANDIRHLQKSRMEKPKAHLRMTPEEIGDMINSLTSSTRARVVTGKNAYPEAVVVPHGEKTYLGVYRPEPDGRVGLQTAYPPLTEKLPNKLGSSKNPQTTFKDWVGASLPSNYAPREGGREFTQRQLSAVEPSKAAVDETIGTDGKGVKAIVPPALLATALGGDSAQTAPSFDPLAYARSLGIDDKPIEEAWWSPADLAVAPVGASGIPAKVLATALDGPLNIGINAAFSRLFGNQ